MTEKRRVEESKREGWIERELKCSRVKELRGEERDGERVNSVVEARNGKERRGEVVSSLVEYN